MHTLALQGPALLPWIDALADLRIRVFAEWPYLYDGSAAYEAEYLRHYASHPQAFVVLALDAVDSTRPVGASTAIRLDGADPVFQAPFLAAGHDPRRIAYFGESVLLPHARGRGLGHTFFDLREAFAASLGCPITTFCAVDRTADDPRRPADARDLAPFWERRGYRRQPALHTRLGWKTHDAPTEVTHTLTFWTRAPERGLPMPVAAGMDRA
jgi:GNAT superfamily N-acetyltransferase